MIKTTHVSTIAAAAGQAEFLPVRAARRGQDRLQGSALNMAAVARECAISTKVVEDYFSILEDLLIAVRLLVFTKRAKRRLIAHPKFFYFDAGAFQAIMSRISLRPRIWSYAWLLSLCSLLAGSGARATEAANTLNVVTLYQEQRMLPSMVEADTALRETIGQHSGRPVEFLNEFIESSRFVAADYETHLLEFLRHKYAGRNVDVLVAVGGNAFHFAQCHRDELFPSAALVFCGLERRELQQFGRPWRSAGVVTYYECAATVEAG